MGELRYIEIIHTQATIRHELSACMASMISEVMAILQFIRLPRKNYPPGCPGLAGTLVLAVCVVFVMRGREHAR